MSGNGSNGKGPLLIGIAVVVVVLLGLWWTAVAHGHDSARPELDKWFASLRNKNKYLCCDQREAKETEYDMRGNHYWVPVNGTWTEVPDAAVLKEPNKFGRPLLWLTAHGVIRCFMPGPGL